MARPFDFSPPTKKAAFLRQGNRCAVCGHDLSWCEDHAHHVIPNQAGDADDPNDMVLCSADNCVILCVCCHEAVHEFGRFRDGAVPPPDYYEYAHGRERIGHTAWEVRMKAVWNRIWGKKQAP